MRKRFTWIVAVLALVSIAVVMACSTKYSSSSNGLVVVPSQGSAVMETFSLNLSNGHASQINNVNGPPIPGVPTSVLLDSSGTFAYVIVNQSSAFPGSVTGIATFQVASDGKLTYIATTAVASPVAMAMDSVGKLLFVANGSAGTVSVFSIGSNASLTPAGVATLPFPTGGQNPFASALAVTPTVFPVQFAACSGVAAPATENLYVADSVNYSILNYAVDTSSGALALVPYSGTQPGIPTGTVPSGVVVDPCGRFVYVANAQPSNSISAYTICSVVSLTCQQPDYSLLAVASPYPAGDSPGPLAVDAYGNFLYVVNTGSNQISGFKISSASGALTPFLSTIATGLGPNSIAIRSDDSWLFVANLTSATVSQYAITPATGILTPQGPISTLNLPTGVAVK